MPTCTGMSPRYPAPMIRLFHTADLHLGLGFTRAGYPPALREQLVERRLEVLREMVAKAGERGCEVFVIAGDLFDTLRVPAYRVREAAECLAKFEGIVVVLPGNHDPLQEGDTLWKAFGEKLGESHQVLAPGTVCDLRPQGVSLVVFPGVCGSRHSPKNAIGWVPGALAALALPDDVVRIGVAHGSLEGLSPDFNQEYFPMSRGELEACGLHLWLLGHTHVRFPDHDRCKDHRIFFPATPEPDGFDCSHGGHAWIIEVDGDGRVEAESIGTGNFRFHTLEGIVNHGGDLGKLKARFASLDSTRDLVKLGLSGRIAGELYDSRREWLEELRGRVLYLEEELSGLLREITAEDIGREFTIGSFPHRLLSGLSGVEGDAEALQLAWELVKEARA